MNPELKWQSMKSAPEDGTRILILDEEHNGHVVNWDGSCWSMAEVMEDTRVWPVSVKNPVAWSRLIVPMVFPCHCGGLFWVQGTQEISFAVCDTCEILLRGEETNTISETIRNFNRKKVK